MKPAKAFHHGGHGDTAKERFFMHLFFAVLAVSAVVNTGFTQ